MGVAALRTTMVQAIDDETGDVYFYPDFAGMNVSRYSFAGKSGAEVVCVVDSKDAVPEALKDKVDVGRANEAFEDVVKRVRET